MAMVREQGGSCIMVRELLRSMAQLRRRPAMAKVWYSAMRLPEFFSVPLKRVFLVLAAKMSLVNTFLLKK